MTDSSQAHHDNSPSAARVPTLARGIWSGEFRDDIGGGKGADPELSSLIESFIQRRIGNMGRLGSWRFAVALYSLMTLALLLGAHYYVHLTWNPSLWIMLGLLAGELAMATWGALQSVRANDRLSHALHPEDLIMAGFSGREIMAGVLKYFDRDDDKLVGWMFISFFLTFLVVVLLPLGSSAPGNNYSFLQMTAPGILFFGSALLLTQYSLLQLGRAMGLVLYRVSERLSPTAATICAIAVGAYSSLAVTMLIFLGAYSGNTWICRLDAYVSGALIWAGAGCPGWQARYRVVWAIGILLVLGLELLMLESRGVDHSIVALATGLPFLFVLAFRLTLLRPALKEFLLDNAANRWVERALTNDPAQAANRERASEPNG